MSSGDETKHRVYIDKVDSDPKTTLERSLQFINWDRYIDKNSTVFVKPNFTFPRYKEGVTTSPKILRSLLELLKDRADTVIVGESDGGNHSFKAEEAFEGHDMYRICKETGVELVNLSNLSSEIVESKILGKRIKLQLPKLLLKDTDCFISVPVLKVHVMTTVTLSLKNLWGCVPDTMRCLHHQNLAYQLALIARFLKPKIVIIDGTHALDKHGPMYGEPIETGLLLAADNSVAADALGAMVMGFLPQKIQHIAVAEKAGIGSLSPEDMEINKDWEQYRRQFQIRKTFIDWVSSLLFCSDILAKLAMDSSLTPVIYKIAGLLRSPDEKKIASQIGKSRKVGLY